MIKKVTSLFLCCFISFLCEAAKGPEEKINLYINPIDSEVISPNLKEKSLKAAYQVLFSIEEYKINFLPKNYENKKGLKGHFLNIKITKDTKTEYKLLVTLEDMESGEKLNEYKKEMIPELNLVRSVHLAVKMLYKKINLGKDKKKVNLNPDRVQPAATKWEKYVALLKERNKRQNELSNQKVNTQVLNKKRGSDIDYDINELKKNIENKVSATRKSIKKKEKERSFKKGKLSKKRKAKKNDAQVTGFENHIERNFSVYSLLEFASIESVDLEPVSNSFSILSIGGWVNIIKDKSDYNSLNVTGSLGKQLNETEPKIPMYKKIGLNYMFGWKDFFSYFTLSFEFEDYVFINVPEFGEGFQQAQNQVLWTKLKVEKFFNFYYEFMLGAQYGFLLSSSSKYEKSAKDLNFQGSYLKLDLAIRFFEVIRTGFQVQNLELRGKNSPNDITLSDTRYSIYAAYDFF